MVALDPLSKFVPTKLLTLEEVCERLALKKQFVRRLVAKNELKAFKIKSLLRFSESQVADYLMGL